MADTARLLALYRTMQLVRQAESALTRLFADGEVPGFFWLAAQGGYGIQSAAGASLLARQLLLGEPLDASLEREGVDVAGLAPARLR